MRGRGNLYRVATLLVVFLLVPEWGVASNYLHHVPGDTDGWQFTGQAELYGSSLDGSLTNVGALTTNRNGSFSASARSLGLSREATGQVHLFASARRWSVGLQYLPLNYDGDGQGLGAVSSGSGGGFAAMQVGADIDIRFLMAEVRYNLIADDSSVLSIGGGVGRVNIDMSLLVEQSYKFSYHKSSPFGYLLLSMENRRDRFFYGATAKGLRFSGWGTYEEHQEYRLDAGWRLYERRQAIDLLAGWRHTRLKFDIGNDARRTRADLDWLGPFVGVAVTF